MNSPKCPVCGLSCTDRSHPVSTKKSNTRRWVHRACVERLPVGVYRDTGAVKRRYHGKAMKLDLYHQMVDKMHRVTEQRGINFRAAMAEAMEDYFRKINA